MNSQKIHRFHRWKPAACLRVSGEDAPRFLQGQFTNDLQKPVSGPGIYGLWLNQKGKVLADSFIEPTTAQEFWVMSYFSPAAVIRERLEAYVIADDVVIEDLTEAMSGLTLWTEASAVATPAGGFRLAGRRGSEAATELVFPTAAESELTSQLENGSGVAAEEMERLRIAAGIARVPEDIGASDLPSEGGLESVAISYTKGCYLGQEVMARLKSMGQVRRRLQRVRGPGEAPATPHALFQKDKKIGDLRSAAVDAGGWAGLAMITVLHSNPSEGVALEAGGDAAIRLETA